MPFPPLQRKTSPTRDVFGRISCRKFGSWSIGVQPHTSKQTHTKKNLSGGLGGIKGLKLGFQKRNYLHTFGPTPRPCCPNRWQPLGSTGRRSAPDLKKPLMKVSKRPDQSIRRTRPGIRCFWGRRGKKKKEITLLFVGSFFQCERQTKSGKVSHEICSG